jgi:hypothetical protein
MVSEPGAAGCYAAGRIKSAAFVWIFTAQPRGARDVLHFQTNHEA